MTRLRTQGWWSSSTALIAFDAVRVPARYLLGQEGQGFKYIMRNFTHERFVLAAMSNRYARVCLEEAVRYARQRKTFGKKLIEHQVIRHKVSQDEHANAAAVGGSCMCGVIGSPPFIGVLFSASRFVRCSRWLAQWRAATRC